VGPVNLGFNYDTMDLTHRILGAILPKIQTL